MTRPALSDEARRYGAALGTALGDRRRERDKTAEEVAKDAGLSVDTLRQIERGRIANPGLFTVAAVAAHLEMDLDDLARDAIAAGREEPC